MYVFNLPPLSALMCSVLVVTRETSPLHQSEPSLVDEMQKTQYCHTTLNTLSHPPWPEPRMDHRGALLWMHLLPASAEARINMCNSSNLRKTLVFSVCGFSKNRGRPTCKCPGVQILFNTHMYYHIITDFTLLFSSISDIIWSRFIWLVSFSQHNENIYWHISITLTFRTGILNIFMSYLTRCQWYLCGRNWQSDFPEMLHKGQGEKIILYHTSRE